MLKARRASYCAVHDTLPAPGEPCWQCISSATKELNDEIRTLREQVDDLREWVDDLHSGMYINCVYCGHRYGPNDEVPATMADALKEHVARCPKHPMSRLREALEVIAAPDMWEQVEGIVSGPDCPDGHNDPLIWLGGDDPVELAQTALDTLKTKTEV